MGFSWVACKAKTGEVIVELPYLTVDAVRQTIGRYESVTASLPIDSEHAPDQWERAILDGGSWLVLLSETVDASGVVQAIPVWGGLVTQSQPDESDSVPITLSTLEAYLDRQYISTTKTYTQVGQNDIAADLINSFVDDAVGGIPIRVQYATAGAGTLRDHEYTDQDDKTVYSALTDWMNVVGGPEWYIGWEHLTSPERYTPVFYVGDRIGVAAPAGMSPNATFDMPGPVQSFQLTRDYSNGKGANVVMAYSSGQGTVRPQSAPQVFTDPDRPKFEYRWTPSTSILDTDRLVEWAQSRLDDQRNGSVALALSASATDPACPQLGTDWFLGDDIGFDIGGLDSNNQDTVPAFRGGFAGVGRAIGYELTLSDTPILTPVLAGGDVA